MAALKKSSPGMRRGNLSNDRIRSARVVATAMSNQLSKTICFICGVCGLNVYAIRDLLSHIQSLNNPETRNRSLKRAPSAFHRRIQLAQSSLVSGALVSHMPRTYRHCACSRGSGRRNIFQQRGSTSLRCRIANSFVEGSDKIVAEGSETMEGLAR